MIKSYIGKSIGSGNILSGARRTNCSAILKGSDSTKSVFATIHGADRKLGTIRDTFLVNPRTAK